jgi:hypothetical protein
MRYEIRELEVGGILDQAVKLTKDHFWLFVKISAVLLVPFSIVAGLWTYSNMPDIPAVPQPGMFVPGARVEYPPGFWTSIFVSGFVNMLVIYPLTDAALIYAIANCYLEKPISVGSAFARGGRIFIPLLLTWILTYLVVMLGFVLFIIPGIIFGLWFSLVSRVVVIEGISGTKAMSRSKQLMKGNMGTAVALGFVALIIGMMVGWAPRVIPQAELQIIVRCVLQAAMSFFVAAAWVVFYFSCRSKVEHFDLTMLAEAVAKDEPSAEGTFG